MANSVDPDQTAIEAVCSGFTLFASVLSPYGNNDSKCLLRFYIP